MCYLVDSKGPKLDEIKKQIREVDTGERRVDTQKRKVDSIITGQHVLGKHANIYENSLAIGENRDEVLNNLRFSRDTMTTSDEFFEYQTVQRCNSCG